MSVFVTDSEFKHTLGIVRSLGTKDIAVDVGSSSQNMQLSSFSKYCRNSFVYPDPDNDPDKFVHYLRAISHRLNYEVIIPVGYTTTFLLSMKKKLINDVAAIPVADFSALKIAANKRESILLAENIGIPTPKTFFKPNPSELDSISQDNYPVVVKGVFGSGTVRYSYTKQDTKNKIEEIYRLQGVFPLVQEFIVGQGYGFFALFNHGKPRAIFMHKRIREIYATGGPSTCAESFHDSNLMEYGLRILKALRWHGIAMVEFKKDTRDGKFKLMEINPKFWGSLDLAISSGVDFPYLLYKMAIDGDITPVFTYKAGLKFMWPFPHDLLHVLNCPHDLKNFFSDLFNPNVRKNIDVNDLGPIISTLHEGTYARAHIISKLARRDVRARMLHVRVPLLEGRKELDFARAPNIQQSSS